MSKFFDSLGKGLEEAIDFAEGKRINARVYSPSPIDLKALRKQINMTQEEFAATFGIGLGTLRHWERGDRKPKGAALVLLNLVQKDPTGILDILYRK